MKKNSARYSKPSRLLAISALALVCSMNLYADTDLKDAKRAIRVRQYDVAYQLYQRAAEAGNSEAQYQLAHLYSTGNGVKKDEALALQWLEKSAAQNYAAAQYSLGVNLIEQERDRALTLINQSATQSYRPAKKYLSRIQSQNNAVQWQDKNEQTQLWFGSARKNAVGDMGEIYAQSKNIDLTDKAGRTALFTAIESNSTEVVEWLLNEGANSNHRDKYGSSAAFTAVDTNRSNLLRLLFKRGANTAQTLKNGDNLLHYALRRERYALLSLLVTSGVPINHKNQEGWTPLDLATYAKENKAVALLTSKGAVKGNGWNTIEGTSREEKLAGFSDEDIDLDNLAKIVISGNSELLQGILARNNSDHEKHLNQKLDDGSTLISLAVKESHTDMVRLLLKAGSYASVPTFSGIRPLHMAARNGSTEIVELLLAAGSDPLTRDEENRDAVQWAIQAKEQATSAMLVDHVLKNPAKRGPVDTYMLLAAQHNLGSLVVKLGPHVGTAAADHVGRNALWFAAQNKNAAIIPLLLSYNVPADAADHEGKTPFYVAVSSDCLACAEQLMNYANIDRQIATGNSPLIAASENANSLLVRWLLEQNANTEITNELRNTALISAVEADAVDVVNLLIEAGANISRKNSLGYSALDIAKKSNQEIYTYLKSRSLLGGF